MHSTNYYNTFIEIAEDCPVKTGEMPPTRGDKKSIANHQFEMLFENPYAFSSDDVLFSIYAIRKEIPENEWARRALRFFQKANPVFGPRH